MRKRGKSFKRHIDPLAAFRSAGRQHPLDESQKISLGVALRTHLEALRTGKADAYAFHNIANAVNHSMVLAEPTGDANLSSAIGAAQGAALKLRINGNKGRWLLDGPGLRDLMQWLDYYEAQLGIASQQEAMDALAEVHRRLSRGQIFEDRVAA